MIPDERADYLAMVAQEMVTRVRDEDPEANARWLASMLPDPMDWWQLAFVLAAATPDDRPWTHLIAWTRIEDSHLMPCGTWAAAQRHRRRGEAVCAECREAERQRNAAEARRRAARSQNRPQPGDEDMPTGTAA